MPIARYLLVAMAALPSPLAAQPQQSSVPAVGGKAERASSFVPRDFKVPTLVEAPGFKIVPLGPALTEIDFTAYMSSIEHLRQSFTHSSDWPRPDITHADALRDMEDEAARFAERKSFAYAVLTPDGRRERGCVYVSPSVVRGYDAVVRMWVTKAEHDAGFDAQLYAWVVAWIRADWPFARVAYPGRGIDRQTWDRLVAAQQPDRAVSAGQNP